MGLQQRTKQLAAKLWLTEYQAFPREKRGGTDRQFRWKNRESQEEGRGLFPVPTGTIWGSKIVVLAQKQMLHDATVQLEVLCSRISNSNAPKDTRGPRGGGGVSAEEQRLKLRMGTEGTGVSRGIFWAAAVHPCLQHRGHDCLAVSSAHITNLLIKWLIRGAYSKSCASIWDFQPINQYMQLLFFLF